MIRNDQIFKNNLVELSPSLADDIASDAEHNELQIIRDYRSVVRSVSVKIPSDLVPGVIDRFINIGYLKKSKTFMGGFFFSITDRFILRKEFWWDNFTKRFLCGYIAGIISGILITVAGGLLLAFFRVLLGI